MMRARLFGAVYLVYFVAAIGGELMMQQAGVSGFSVSSDAAAFASKLLAHQAEFQLGFALNLVSVALYVAVTTLFYVMLRPVNRTLALIATLMSLVGQAVAAVAGVLLLAPLAVLGGGSFLTAFSTQQLQALALLFLHIDVRAGSITLLFAGFFQVIAGCLIYRSTFLPRVIGGLVALAGIGWFAFLVPPLVRYIGSYLEALGVVAEFSLMLWLLIRGVKVERWTEMARRVA